MQLFCGKRHRKGFFGVERTETRVKSLPGLVPSFHFSRHCRAGLSHAATNGVGP
jgi:hypothetical protein